MICITILISLGKIQVTLDSKTIVSLFLIVTFTYLRAINQLAEGAYTVMVGAVGSIYGVAATVSSLSTSTTVREVAQKLISK